MSGLVLHVTSVFMLVVGLSFLFQTRQWLRFTKDVMEAPYRFFPASFVLVVLGSAIVAAHNQWSLNWNLAITVYGWALLLKGAALLIVPQFSERFAGWSDRLFVVWTRVGGAILAAVGGILTYQIWFAA
jgi:hypothetical protein